MTQEQNGKNFFDIVIVLYDKNPVLAGALLLITVSTPVLIAWFNYLKKKEEVNLEKFKHIANQRGKLR